jgi:hypothetical protein
MSGVDPDHLRFFADESALGVGKALSILRDDVIHAGHPLIPNVPLGTSDPDWMPVVARRGLVVICRDAKIRRKLAERALFYSEGLRALWIGGDRDMSNWDNIVRLVRRWADIEQVMHDRPAGPWFYQVNAIELKELPVTPPLAHGTLGF